MASSAQRGYGYRHRELIGVDVEPLKVARTRAGTWGTRTAPGTATGDPNITCATGEPRPGTGVRAIPLRGRTGSGTTREQGRGVRRTGQGGPVGMGMGGPYS